MINDTYTSKNIQANDKLSKYKIIKPKIDISFLNNRLKYIKNNNISKRSSNVHISDISNIQKNKSIKNLILKNENMFLNISALTPQNNIEKNPIFNNHFKKIKENSFLNKEIQDKYSNAILFKNRISKHMLFLNQKKTDLNKNKSKLGNNINSSENKLQDSKQNVLTPKNYNNINNYFLIPRKRINSRNYELNKNYSYNNSHNFVLPSSKIRKPLGIFLPRVNSAFSFPKKNSPKTERNSSLILNKEKEKLIINENLQKLFQRLNKKIMPKKRNILNSPKLPSVLNKNKNKDEIKFPNSCIHKNEYGNFIVFEKTHLDGLEEEKRKERKKAKTLIKYDINEGYVDLNVLNSGNNKSFKTNLIHRDGIYFYEFNKYGRIETVEEKVHRVKKDKIGFRKLLERFDKNELYKNIENLDYELNIKKIYGAEPVINKNIYKDLYHILFKK